MDMEELESRLAEMFPDGVRICTSVGDPDSHIFWAAHVPVSEDALLLTPAGMDLITPYVFSGDPVFAEDGRSVIFYEARSVGSPESYAGMLRLDKWFTPNADTSKIIKAEQEARNGD